MESEHDKAFLQILRDEKNITNFLDAFFGFLYRCTDFYVECGPDHNLGFPPGVAETLVLSSLQKWMDVSKIKYKSDKCSNSRSTHKTTQRSPAPVVPEKYTDVPTVAQEVEVQAGDTERKIERICNKFAAKSNTLEESKPSDSYNGAVRENYTWSQSISDLDVLIKLPNTIKTAKDIKVSLDSQRIKIEKKAPQTTSENASASDGTKDELIFDAELSFKVKKDESIWSVIPGQQINIHLEKATERWWESLIIGEPKIQLNKIDCARDLHDMGYEEQMKVQELMWNHQQKLLGKPTSEQIKLGQILKEAWDAEGSPFQGTPYDPSKVKQLLFLP